MTTLRNRVQLIGNLGMNPEVKEFGNRKMSRFSLATNEKFKDQKGNITERTSWHTLVAWGSVAELSSRLLSKGCEVAVEGKLNHRSYDKNGVKQYITEIIMSDFKLMTRKTVEPSNEMPF